MVAQDKAVQMSPLQLHCINRRLLLPFASSGESLCLCGVRALSSDMIVLMDSCVQGLSHEKKCVCVCVRVCVCVCVCVCVFSI